MRHPSATPLLSVTLALALLSGCPSDEPEGTTPDVNAPDVVATSDAGDAASSDTGPAGPCQACLPAGGLPTLGDVALESLNRGAGDDCAGVCIRIGDTGDGRCVAPEEPGKACDYRAGGFEAEAVHPALASEPFTIRAVPDNGCKADDCMCNQTQCQGTGDPFRKSSVVIVPKDGATRDELFVFLGGTGGSCTNHKWITSMAATAGYRAICLAYINDPSALDYCIDAIRDDPQTSCGNDFRRENIYGEDTLPILNVGPHNSIVGRLTALLQHLDATAPERGFGAYLSAGDIAWEKVVISGFSQGGGNAGILSQDHAVARAVFFSKGIGSTFIPQGESCATPADCTTEAADSCVANNCVATEPSAYVTQSRATPAERTFGIIHVQEGAITYSPDAFRQWGMDVCGDLVPVEDRADDYGCARMLTTDATPGGDNPEGFHGSMGTDGAMAKDADGYPLNQRAYLYMMTAE